MAVTPRSKAEKIETITGNTTVTEPAGAVSGDVLIALALADIDGVTVITRPSGWTGPLYNGIQGAVRWDLSWITRGGSAPNLTWTISGTSKYREVFVVCLQAGAAISLDSQSATGGKGNASTNTHSPNPPSTTAVASSSLAICGGVHFAGSTGGGGWALTGYTVQTANAAGDDGVLFSKALSAPGVEDPAAMTTGSNTAAADYWDGFTVTFTDVSGGVTNWGPWMVDGLRWNRLVQ